MRSARWLLIPALAICSSAVAAPPIPETPAPIQRLIAARPYVAPEPLGLSWDRSQPPSRRGWLLVIEADPGLTATRQAAEPNLFAGAHLAARAGRASSGGVGLYLLPADVDLASAPLYFGTPELPEAVTPETAQSQESLAAERRLEPPTSEQVAAALAAGGSEVRIDALADLRDAKRDLRERFLR